MRNIVIGLAGTVAALSAAPAFAHPEEHGSNYRAPSTTELAQQAVVKLVAEAKLPTSWSQARVTGSSARTKKGVEQNVVKFENVKIRQPAKRFLYVIMTTDGKFVSANHKLI